MWFQKAKAKEENYPYPGVVSALDGHGAAYTIESAADDTLVVHDGGEHTEITGPFRQLAPAVAPAARLREAAGPAQALSTAVGQTLAGLRSAVMLANLRGVYEHLSAAAGKRLPMVLHLTCKARTRQAGALHGGHDDYYAAADTGWFELFASDVQEVADFALIARRIAELALTPGICAQDLYGTSQAVQGLRLPERALIARYLGRPGDAIDAPSEAQKILFGARRRRVPLLIDPDHPAGIGGVQDRESYFKGLVSARAFFAGDVERIVNEAMREFGDLTGRYYERAAGYRADDADVLVLAQGSVVNELRPVVDYLRSHDMAKAGIVNLSMLRPFPGARLSHWLKGKKAVTVLERTDGALGEDLPLMRDVRAAVDRAMENGLAAKKIPHHTDYATYNRPDDRPLLLSGIYGVGRELPTFGELLAVFCNMLAGGKGTTRFYTGADFEQDTRRFPQLQMLQQHLNQAYPAVQNLSLPAVAVQKAPAPNEHAMQLLSLSAQGGLFAGNLFAQALAESLGWDVRTFPESGLEASLQPAVLTVSRATGGAHSGGRPASVGTILVSDPWLIEQLASRCTTDNGGALIVGSTQDPETLWRQLSNRTANWIRTHALRLYVIDARKIASETTALPTFVDQLMMWALLGAWLQAVESPSEDDLGKFMARLRGQLERVFGGGDERIDDVIGAVQRGAGELEAGDWSQWDEERPVKPEADAPWIARKALGDDETVFDGTRFWRSVGYLYESGQAEHALGDPFVATGILPARSSAARNMTPFRLRIPQWLAENCTGCGLCWTHCPESALPSSLHTISGIIAGAIAESTKRGAAIVQMRRISDPLAKQAYQLFGKEGPHAYTTAGSLLQDAFDQVTKKMKITGDPLAAVTAEFDAVRGAVDDYPIARTDGFFTELNQNKKGSGRLLSIALNPLSCTGCGICIEECPDDAFEWSDQNTGALDVLHKNRELQMALPVEGAAFVDTLVSPSDPQTETRRLLDATAYGSLVGGDGSYPGNAGKTALHLVAATVESVMGARFQAHVDRLSRLIERIEGKIQGDVEAVVQINDFEAFTQRLNRVAKKELSADALGALLGDNGDTHDLDAPRLKRLGDLLASLEEQRRSYVDGAGDTGRSRMIMAMDGHDGPFWSGTYPYNPHRHSWGYHLPGDGPTLAVGILDGMARRIAGEIAACRRAELELDDAYDPQEHDAFFDAFDRNEFTAEEWALVPPVVVVGSDGYTRWEDVSRLIATGYPVKVVIVNNNIIEGTGAGVLAVAHGGAFVVQASVGHPGHLMRAVGEALRHQRPAVIDVYAPNALGARIAPERVVPQARLAYEGRTFPLFTFDPDRDGARLAVEDNPSPGDPWTTHELVIKEASGRETTLVAALTPADWALGESQYRPLFKTVSKGNLNDQMKTLDEYVALEPEAREGLTPFVHAVDAEGHHVLALVPPMMVHATERAAAVWAGLQAMAAGTCGEAPAAADNAAAPPAPATEPASASVDATAYERVTQRLLELAGYGRDTDFFKRSLRDFVTENREAAEE